MQNLMYVALLVSAFVVYSEAVCCGRGKHGFCNDCSKVQGILSLSGQKCCGSGSGRGNGCNVFCCNCNSCRAGTPLITYVSGWWFHSKYTCRRSTSAGDGNRSKDVFQTMKAFKSLDKDNDNSLNQNEFLEGLHSNLNMDFESSYALAVDLLNDDDAERTINLLDATKNDKKLNKDELLDIMRTARAEFNKMDSNRDGIIQANEFDKDLA